MTSSSEIKSRMSIVGGYSNLSAAGSRLKRWMLRPIDWAWVMIELQNVDLPEPAGPLNGRREGWEKGEVSSGWREVQLVSEVAEQAGDEPVTRMA